MPNLNKNLNYDSNINIAFCTKSLRIIIASGLKGLKEALFLYTTLALLTKFVLFLGLINNTNATSFNFVKAFWSFNSPPPLVVYVSMIVIVLSFALLFKGRTRFWFLVICNSFISLLLVADLMYYRGFKQFCFALFIQSNNQS